MSAAQKMSTQLAKSTVGRGGEPSAAALQKNPSINAFQEFLDTGGLGRAASAREKLGDMLVQNPQEKRAARRVSDFEGYEAEGGRLAKAMQAQMNELRAQGQIEPAWALEKIRENLTLLLSEALGIARTIRRNGHAANEAVALRLAGGLVIELLTEPHETDGVAAERVDQRPGQKRRAKYQQPKVGNTPVGAGAGTPGGGGVAPGPGAPNGRQRGSHRAPQDLIYLKGINLLPQAPIADDGTLTAQRGQCYACGRVNPGHAWLDCPTMKTACATAGRQPPQRRQRPQQRGPPPPPPPPGAPPGAPGGS